MKPRSAVALTDADRIRLARLLGMLGSDHDGEVANAGRLADRLVRGAGLTWLDVVEAPALPTTPQPESLLGLLRDWPTRWQAAARFCADCGTGRIRTKDIDFATKISAYTHRPSEAQLVWLRDITERVLTGGAS
jgi:hypothetical protein